MQMQCVLTTQIIRGLSLHTRFRVTEKGVRSPAPETAGRAAQRDGGAGLCDGIPPSQPFGRSHLLSHGVKNPGTV